MLKLKFKSDSYGSVTVPIYKAYVHNYDPNYKYFATETQNNKITILEEPSECFSWIEQITDLPKYDDFSSDNDNSFDRSYSWEKNSNLVLNIIFRRFNAAQVGRVNQRGISMNIHLAFLAKSYYLYSGTTIPSPHPFYTGGSEVSYGIATFFYDTSNKCFMSLKPPSVTIQSMTRLSGYWQEYGDMQHILVTSNSYHKGDILLYTKGISWTMDGKTFDGNTKIKHGEHIGKKIYQSLNNNNIFDSNFNSISLYDLLYKTSKDDPSFDFDDGTEDDPNDDDPGSEDNPDYDDDDGGDGDHDDSSDNIPEDELPTISGTSNGLTTSWNLTTSQLATLAQKLWNPDFLDTIKQYFTNPMDAILSLCIIPVSPDTTTGTIHLGGYNTGINAHKISKEYMKVSLGSIEVNRYYGSYLDYSPFTKISCILPYIGEVELDPDQIMQKTVSISYHINCVTGELCAYILANNSVIATYAGNCAKQLPICQTDYSSIIASSVQIATTAITAGAALVAAPVAAAGLSASTAMATQAAASNVAIASSTLGTVMNAKPNYKHASQLGTGVGQLSTQAAYLVITRPNLDLATNYKAYTGYPCNKRLLIGMCKGFTQIEASNLSISSATLEEIAEIKELLLEGVII